jgi:Vacuolar sorting-associated protein 13, N-terminal
VLQGGDPKAASKAQRVEAAEMSWFQDMSADPAPAAEPGGGSLWWRALIDTIIGNLQLSITNVHIRYEARVVSPAHLSVRPLRGHAFIRLLLVCLSDTRAALGAP